MSEVSDKQPARTARTPPDEERTGLTDMELRRIEMACGVLGGALGFIALGVGLFAPVWHWYCEPLPGMNGCHPYYTGVHFALLGQTGIVALYTTVVAVLALGVSIVGTVAALRHVPAHV